MGVIIYYPNTISSARIQFLADWLANHPLSPNVNVETQAKSDIFYTISYENRQHTFQHQDRFLTDQIKEYTSFRIRKTADWYHFDWENSSVHSHPDVFEFWFYFLAAYGEQRWPDEFLNEQLCYKDEVHTLIQHNLHHIPICDYNLKVFWALLGFEIDNRLSKFVITHDVDYIKRFTSRLKLFKSTIGSFVRTKKISIAKDVWKTGGAALRKLKSDPYDTFENLLLTSKHTKKILYLLCRSYVKEDGGPKGLGSSGRPCEEGNTKWLPNWHSSILYLSR